MSHAISPDLKLISLMKIIYESIIVNNLILRIRQVLLVMSNYFILMMIGN